MKSLRLGKTEIELLYHENEFLGLGAITIDGIAIRAGQLPLRPLLLSVDGIAFGCFFVDRVCMQDNRITLHITARGVHTGQSLYMDHLGIQTARFAGLEPPTLSLRWVFADHERRIDETAYRGLSWHYEVDGGEHVFFDMSEQGSWEIGGSVDGNRLLYQGEHLSPEIDLAADTVVDSTWTITNATPCWNAAEAAVRESKKLHPLCSMPLRISKNQPFDFLAHRLGTFTTFFAPEMEYVGCVMLKKAGQTILPWQERYRFAETAHFITPERYVLFAQAGQPHSRVQVRNDWTRVHDEVGNALRAAHGISHFRSPASVGICTWHCWEGLCSKDEYIAKAGRHLDLLGKTFMPLFGQMGFTSYYLHPLWKSALPGLPHCCVDRFEPDPVVGGWDALRKLNDDAAAAGITISPWVSMHLWEKSSIFNEHPEWKIKARDTWNYTPGFPKEIAQVDLAGGYADYLFEMLKAARERTGIGGLFFDTMCTHALYNISWQRQAQTHVKAVADLIGRLTAIGFDICAETVTPFVRAARGEDALRPDFRFAQAAAPGHHNNSGWANYKLGALGPHVGQKDIPPDWDEMYYRRLANRCTGVINFAVEGFNSTMVAVDEAMAGKIEKLWTRKATQANLDYNAAEPFLHKRTLLEDEAGVLWEDRCGKIQHLFCFRPMRFASRKASVLCLTTGKRVPPASEIACESYRTYRIELPAEGSQKS